MSQPVRRDQDFGHDGLNPERCCHLDGICIGAIGLSFHKFATIDEKGDIGRAATWWSDQPFRCNVDLCRLGDGLACNGIAQDDIRIMDHLLRNSARLDETREILRNARGTLVSGGLTVERGNIASTYVLRCDERFGYRRGGH